MIESMLSLTALPNVHPALVHFPIVFAGTGLLVDLVCLATRKWEWLRSSAAMLYVLAAVGSVATYFSGRQAAGTVGALTAQAEAVLADHADLALLTMLVLILAATLRLTGAILHRRERLSAKLALAAAIVAMMAANVLVAVTADHGGALVYGHGVAVMSSTKVASHEETNSTQPLEHDAGDNLSLGDDGSLLWQPSTADGDSLYNVLQTVQGASAEVLKPAGSTVDGDAGLRIEVSGATVVTIPGSFGDVMVTADVDLQDFEGVFGLGHHIQSGGDGVFFTVTSTGKAGLIRRNAEKEDSMGQGVYEPTPGPVTLRTSVSGRHLKGLIGDQMIVHGHGPSGDDGAIGLIFDGHGAVEIKQISVEPILDY